MRMPTDGFSPFDDHVERQTLRRGHALFAQIGEGSSPLERAWWDDRFMDLTMGDPMVKVQLFRFIDVLPTLRRDAAVRRHLEEYLAEAGDRVPAIVALPVSLTPRGRVGDRLLGGLARVLATRMAGRFIAGSTPDEALQTVKRLRNRRLAFTADLLGEAVTNETEANLYQRTCLELLQGLAKPLSLEREVRQIDRDESGPIPRVNLSLKLTSLTTWFDALHPDSTTRRVLTRLRPILRTARKVGAFVNVDMEQFAHKDLTYEIFKDVLDEPEFRGVSNVGVVTQAYLPEALGDLEMLRDWARRRGTPVTIRLVKGAYWDYEVLHARQVGWPVPVYLRKWETDANFERCTRFLFENRAWLRPALGSHNVRSIANAMAIAESMGVPREGYEIQMLHGMGEPIQRALVGEGRRVRLYTPYGAMLPGMAYLVRRLLENTSNESFLKASSAGALPAHELLRNPQEIGEMWRAKNRRTTPKAPAPAVPPFRNEPPVDFTRPENRRMMSAALEEARTGMFPSIVGDRAGVCPVIAGEPVEGGQEVVMRDPSDASHVLGKARYGSAGDAERAVSVARNAFPRWSATSAQERAGVLLRAAEVMRRDRFSLAAVEVFECGKPWREADADVAEAIDFCEFYAREMIRLDEPTHRDVAGETNAVEHIARGVAVIIPPWNFPLAIPTGMTVAALVAGNTVILKPAEQSQVIALRLFETLREAGLPPDVLSYLPGKGEVVGQALVDDPRVDLIAFTGSRPVGLEINRRAAETKPGQDHVKRVIAEMGGKNAIIVDDDADLDEAVVGVLHSAFGYAGQKCSACSRLIVHEAIYDTFLARLADAAKVVPVGPAADPETIIGPVIDSESRDRIRRYHDIARTEGRVVVSVDVGSLADHGNFVGPFIVADIHPEARLAQEEIFGPVLAVMKAHDLDDALKIANGTEFALTGGLYSRSPANIERVKREFRVGNLYINRPITGALVDRQPFGGFKLSGIGTKAGGSHYLREFLLAKVVTENTMRRGFAPEEEIEAALVGAAVDDHD
jgi:RHH-type transcriptional regulator, proline utilization regulon repressor / proline dehydrogenase / delta 1-pyrroline-5-carboxylate dehydrogenase